MVFTHDSVEFFLNFIIVSLRVRFKRISAIGQLHQPITLSIHKCIHQSESII